MRTRVAVGLFFATVVLAIGAFYLIENLESSDMRIAGIAVVSSVIGVALSFVTQGWLENQKTEEERLRRKEDVARERQRRMEEMQWSAAQAVEDATLLLAQLTVTAFYFRIQGQQVPAELQVQLIDADSRIVIAGNRTHDEELKAAIAILMAFSGTIRNPEVDIANWQGIDKGIKMSVDLLATAISEFRDELAAKPGSVRTTNAREMVKGATTNGAVKDSGSPAN